jgi:predicted TPR repeat methyltransferase
MSFHATTIKRLKSGAFYVFSVENSNSVNFILRNSGRYAQSRAYIEKLASTHGFSVEVAEPANIRKHGNEFMQGTIYILKYL